MLNTSRLGSSWSIPCMWPISPEPSETQACKSEHWAVESPWGQAEVVPLMGSDYDCGLS